MEIVIGYIIKPEEFKKLFCKIIPAKTHKEHRFDPRTGKQVEDEIVVDSEEHFEYTVFGKKFCDYCGAILEIAKKAKCNYYASNELTFDTFEIIFYLRNVREGKILRVNEYYADQGPIKFNHLISLKPQVDNLKRRLCSMGFKCGQAKLLIIDSNY